MGNCCSAHNLEELDDHNERPDDYQTCVSPLLKPENYNARFIRRAITYGDAIKIATNTRELEDFADVQRYLKSAQPEFFCVKVDMSEFHDGQVEDIFRMCLKQRMICSMDIDMHYTCFEET